MLRIQFHGAGEIRQMARRLEEAPDHLRQNLARSLRNAAQPTLRDMKRNIETNPIRGFRTGSRHRFARPSSPKGLRRRIAAATEMRLNVGSDNPSAVFTVYESRLGSAHRLPTHIERGTIWRHPIMGKFHVSSRGKFVRHGWAGEQGKPWFRPAFEKNLPLFRRRVDEAVARTERQLGG